MPKTQPTVAQLRLAVERLEAAVLALEGVPSAYGGPAGSILLPALGTSGEVEEHDKLSAVWDLLEGLVDHARAQLADAERAR